MLSSRINPAHAARRVLEPEERIAEALFGTIMVITFTGSLSVASAGREDVRTMVVGALGCNLAWGIIDAVFYLMGNLADRGRKRSTLRALKAADRIEDAERLLARALPPLVASVIEPAALTDICRKLSALPEPPPSELTSRDLLGALGVFLLVFLATGPIAIPFVVVHDVALAMRLSNAVALATLLVIGAYYGRVIGRSPWRYGLGMTLLGCVLVALTIALGG